MEIEPVYPSRETEDGCQKQTKVISTKLSVYQHNRFNILAEYLYRSGLTEGHTPSTLLRASIDSLLLEYHDKLDEYCANSTMNSNLPIPMSQPLSLLLSQEPKHQSESDKLETHVSDLIIEEIQSRYHENEKNYYDMDKEHEIQERIETTQTLPNISSELEDTIDELANRVMSIMDQFDRIYETAKEEDYPIDEIIEDKERLKDFLMI